MKAFAFDDFGGQGSIHTMPDPVAGEGEVLVAVSAASVNPFDASVLAGNLKDRLPHRFPLVPCSDFAGRISALGEGVRSFNIGERVFGTLGKMGQGEGSLAELTVASASTITTTPEELSDREAAAIVLAGISALQIVDAVAPAEGDTVVVIGASGGIGGYAVQMARARGAHVVGVTSGDKVEYVRGLGAAEVIDRGIGAVAEAITAAHPDGVAAIIDTISDREHLSRLTEVVRAGARVASMRGAADVEGLAARGIIAANIGTRMSTETLEALKELLRTGILRSPGITEFPLERAGEALAAIRADHPPGKLVVRIS